MTKFIFNEEVERDEINELADNLERNGFGAVVRHGWIVEMEDDLSAVDLMRILELIDNTIGLDSVDHINVNR